MNTSTDLIVIFISLSINTLLLFLLWKMTKKFYWQRDAADRLFEIALRYRNMLNMLSEAIKDEKLQFAELDKIELDR